MVVGCWTGWAEGSSDSESVVSPSLSPKPSTLLLQSISMLAKPARSANPDSAETVLVVGADGAVTDVVGTDGVGTVLVVGADGAT